MTGLYFAQYLLQEIFGAFGSRCAKECCYRRLLNDLAVVHEDDFVSRCLTSWEAPVAGFRFNAINWSYRMGSLTVRNLDESVKNSLRVRAARHGWSLEHEV